jgi:hypothetical protein
VATLRKRHKQLTRLADRLKELRAEMGAAIRNGDASRVAEFEARAAVIKTESERLTKGLPGMRA